MSPSGENPCVSEIFRVVKREIGLKAVVNLLKNQEIMNQPCSNDSFDGVNLSHGCMRSENRYRTSETRHVYRRTRNSFA